MSEKMRISLRPVCFSFRNSIACSKPPVMSVKAAGRDSPTKLSTRLAKARFCRLVLLGRSSKDALAMMFFSLKLPASMRATAIESSGCRRESAYRTICSALLSCRL